MDLETERELLTEAYEKGYEEFEGFSSQVEETTDFASYRDMARFTNVIAPQLRMLAGFEDSGPGTFTEGGEEEIEMYGEVTDMFFMGAFDAVNGVEKDHTRHIGSDLQ